LYEAAPAPILLYKRLILVTHHKRIGSF